MVEEETVTPVVDNTTPRVDRFHTQSGNFVRPARTSTVQDEPIRLISIEYQYNNSLKARRVADLERFLYQLGHPGRFQVMIFVLLSFAYCIIAANNLAVMFFTLPSSEYLCSNEVFVTATTVMGMHAESNLTTSTRKPTTRTSRKPVSRIIEREDVRYWFYPSEMQQCYLYVNTTSGPAKGQAQKHVCDSWRYPADTISGAGPARTIINQFQLLCGKLWMAPLSSFIYFLGCVVGGPLTGYLSDRCGRRIVFLMTVAVSIVFGVGSSFAPNYIAFCILRFILGIAIQGIQTFFCLIIEWISSEHRAVLTAAAQCFWSFGVMFLSLLAYLLPDWNHLQLVVALGGLLLVFAYFFTIEESLRWLLIKNRTRQAAEVAGRTVRLNRIAHDLSWELEHELLLIGASFLSKEGNAKMFGRRGNLMNCFRMGKMRKTFICLFCIWFALGLIYYALSLPVTGAFDQIPLNLVICGAVEFVINLLCIFLCYRIGRKKPLMVLMFFGGLITILSLIIRDTDRPSHIGRVVMTICGRSFISGGIGIGMVWTCELFPTIIRCCGFGVSMAAFRLGAALAALLALFGHSGFHDLPIILISLTAMAGTFAAYPLCDTWHQRLPDTLQDMENMSGSSELSNTSTQTKDGHVESFVSSRRPSSSFALTALRDSPSGRA